MIVCQPAGMPPEIAYARRCLGIVQSRCKSAGPPICISCSNTGGSKHRRSNAGNRVVHSHCHAAFATRRCHSSSPAWCVLSSPTDTSSKHVNIGREWHPSRSFPGRPRLKSGGKEQSGGCGHEVGDRGISKVPAGVKVLAATLRGCCRGTAGHQARYAEQHGRRANVGSPNALFPFRSPASPRRAHAGDPHSPRVLNHVPSRSMASMHQKARDVALLDPTPDLVTSTRHGPHRAAPITCRFKQVARCW
ncbi:hypothetical protein QBC47DRAFT_213343 [Echria macrotheca]|uniref:Uncharacterized protein n=1 Tax=Echria macrotheca TaxID=438768 RepID=A0AAJ0BC34_9PEZI|nr:hypothetical protein QBC47DRAFT_213343 [Echria macrotheca]